MLAVAAGAAGVRLSGAPARPRRPHLDSLLTAVSIPGGRCWSSCSWPGGACASTGPSSSATSWRRPRARSSPSWPTKGRVSLTLYTVRGDPRHRGTKLLLDQIAAAAGRERQAKVTTDMRDLDASPEEEDHYGIGSSNTVVLLHGGNWELVERPTEGALYEALEKLLDPANRMLLYVATGTGEGDFERSDDAGFSGLRAALETEGYAVRPLPTAVRPDVPEDADGLLVIAPERRMTEAALAAIRRYLTSAAAGSSPCSSPAAPPASRRSWPSSGSSPPTPS